MNVHMLEITFWSGIRSQTITIWIIQNNKNIYFCYCCCRPIHSLTPSLTHSFIHPSIHSLHSAHLTPLREMKKRGEEVSPALVWFGGETCFKFWMRLFKVSRGGRGRGMIWCSLYSTFSQVFLLLLPLRVWQASLPLPFPLPLPLLHLRNTLPYYASEEHGMHFSLLRQ